MAAVIFIMCVHWPLYLPPLRKNEQWLGLSEANEKENKSIWQVKSDHWQFMWFFYFSISDGGAKHREKKPKKNSKFSALDLNCRLTLVVLDLCTKC